jgi:hypothetical protein
VRAASHSACGMRQADGCRRRSRSTSGSKVLALALALVLVRVVPVPVPMLTAEVAEEVMVMVPLETG